MSVQTFDPYALWLGIPANEQPAHYYRLLGLALFENNPAAIAANADQRLQYLANMAQTEYAPYANQLYQEVAYAKAYLLDPNLKAQYDPWLQQMLSQMTAAAAQPNYPAAAAAPAQPAQQTGYQQQPGYPPPSSHQQQTGYQQQPGYPPQPSYQQPATTAPAQHAGYPPGYVPSTAGGSGVLATGPAPANAGGSAVIRGSNGAGIMPPTVATGGSGVMATYPANVQAGSSVNTSQDETYGHQTSPYGGAGYGGYPMTAAPQPTGQDAIAQLGEDESISQLHQRHSNSAPIGIIVGVGVAIVALIIVSSVKFEPQTPTAVAAAPTTTPTPARTSLADLTPKPQAVPTPAATIDIPKFPFLEPSKPAPEPTGEPIPQPMPEPTKSPVPMPMPEPEPMKTPTPPPAPMPPKDPEPTPEELAAWNESTAKIRTALYEREVEFAEDELDVLATSAKTDAQKDELDRLKMATKNLKSFWTQVAKTLEVLQASEEFEVKGRLVVVVEADESKLIIRATGMNRRWETRKIPTSIAMYLAQRSFNPGPITKLIYATHYLYDQEGHDPLQARALFDEVGRTGDENAKRVAEFLRPEIDIAKPN